jgi:phosphoglycolate phosphatase-like HAD superfamily hydrolase
MRHINGAILDVDGTLADTNDLHAYAWVAAFEKYGLTVPFSKIRGLIGMGSDHLIPIVLGDSPSPDIFEQLTRDRLEIFDHVCLPHVTAFPGARALLTTFQHEGIPYVIASSAQRAELDAILSNAELSDLVPVLVCGDDVFHSKPSPDLVAEALAHIDLEPNRVAMIGDTPYDVKAALKNGVPCIAFRSGGWADYELNGALAIYNNVEELVHKFESSVFGQRFAQVDGTNYADLAPRFR